MQFGFCKVGVEEIFLIPYYIFSIVPETFEFVKNSTRRMEGSFYPPYCIEGVNMDNLHIICPVRGQLKVKKKVKRRLDTQRRVFKS